jgi:hypothetical protein
MARRKTESLATSVKIMKQFWQAEIRDPTCLHGKSVAYLLTVVASAVASDDVVVSAIEGAGESVPELMEISDGLHVSRLDSVRAILEGITQLDWGDFTFVRGALRDRLRNEYPTAVVKHLRVEELEFPE